MPCDRRAPIVADHDEALMAEGGGEIGDVVAQVDDVVGLDRRRVVAAP